MGAASSIPSRFPPDFSVRALEEMPALVWCTGGDGDCFYGNRATLDFLGRATEDILGRGWTASLHPDDREQCVESFRAAASGSKPLEHKCRVKRYDGEFRWMCFRIAALRDSQSGSASCIGVAVEIPEVELAPRPRRDEEELVRLLGEATRDLIWTWNLQTHRIATNRACVETLGDIPTGVRAAFAWWQRRVHPEDHQRVRRTFETALAGDALNLAVEYRIRDPFGNALHVEDHITIRRDSSGTALQVIGTARDVTERKRAQAAQSRLVRILEATPDFVAIFELDGTILYLNRAGREFCGLQPNEPLQDLSLKCSHPAWAYEIVREEGIPTAVRDGMWEGESCLLTHDGQEIPVLQLILSHPRNDGSIECVSTILRDISDRKNEEVARIEWANRYDAAIQASGQLLVDWDSVSGEITYGGNTERILGYTVSEMSGGIARLRELVHPEDEAAFDQEVRRVAATREPFFLKFRLRHREGHYLYVQAKGYFFLDRDGRLTRMIGFLADVTAQHQAQEELAQAQESLEVRVQERTAELAHTYIVIQDRALQQESVARLGQRALAGADLTSLLDEATSLVRTILKVDICCVFELEADGGSLLMRNAAGWEGIGDSPRVGIGHESQSGYTLEVGEPVIVEDMRKETRFNISALVREAGITSGVSVMIAAGEQPIGVLAAWTFQRREFTKDDVHFLQSVANVLTAAIARQRAEEKIRLAHEQAERANRAKSEFLSRMSHELRTPLNAILGFTQLLELDAPSPTQTESIEHISRAGKHLLSLINEVLDIARIEAGRLALSPEPVGLDEFLPNVVELIRPFAKRHAVELRVHPISETAPPYVLADRQRLKQVLLNLLSNAVKYNRPGGSVTVECIVCGGGERQRISVADTGLGIPDEKLQRLFVPFERLGAEATDIEGTGIGLALSRGIVSALHGELGVDSQVGKGSTFWVELPATSPSVAPNEMPAVQLPFPTASAGTKRHLLLYVEDQDLNLRLVERIFQHRPEYALISSMQGGLALELAREHQPELILLDLNLPDMAGDEVLARLKQDPATREIPVIMVSADAMGERIEQLLKQGAAGYLTKPYRLAEFLRMIEDNLKKDA